MDEEDKIIESMIVDDFTPLSTAIAESKEEQDKEPKE